MTPRVVTASRLRAARLPAWSRTGLRRLLGTGLCVAGLCAAGLATAGPREDTERGEASLRSGDLITAMALFKQAADAGHGPAQARLGDLMDAAEQNGDAVAWYRKAAEQGDPAGQYGLGRMYAVGKGLGKDPAQALQWFQKAAQGQHVMAVEALARAHRSGDLGLAKDLAEATRLDAQAKALRDQQAALAAQATPKAARP